MERFAIPIACALGSIAHAFFVMNVARGSGPQAIAFFLTWLVWPYFMKRWRHAVPLLFWVPLLLSMLIMLPVLGLMLMVLAMFLGAHT